MVDPTFKSQMWIVNTSVKRRFHIKSFLIGTLATLICGLMIWPLLPRYYQAQTTLIFRAPEQGDRISFLKQDLDEKAIQSELDILSSPVLTQEVIKRLGLQNDLELTAPSPLSPFTLMTNAWSATPRLDAGRNALARLTVQHDRRSYTVRFGYLSKDPQKSTEMTALLSSIYLDELSARKQRLLARDADIARSRLLSATARQAQLNTAIDEVTKQSSTSDDHTILSDLLNEKSKVIQLANNARTQIEEALARAGNNDSDADVITPATLPSAPLFPDPLIFAVALSFASLTFGLLMAFMDFDALIRKFRA
jgi:uncharacterized protein involved in exopolysaccharide biosynthesis